MKNDIRSIRKILLCYFLIDMVLTLCLPNTVKTNLTIDIYGISIFWTSIPYIFILSAYSLYRIQKNQINKLLVPICFLIIIIFLSCLTTNFIIQRFLISVQFLLPIFILYSFDINEKDSLTIRFFSITAFVFISLQVILISFGIVSPSNENVTEVNNLIRGGTTAGPATFTAPVLLLLYAILIVNERSKFMFVLFTTTVFVVIFLLLTRSALIVLVLVFFCSVWFSKINILKKTTICLIFLSVFFLLNKNYEIIKTIEARNEQARVYSDGDILTGRIERWDKLFVTIDFDNLLIGIGGANTPYFNYYKDTSIKSFYSPHNVYLSILLEHGIICLFIFLFWLLSIIKSIKDKNSVSFFVFLFIIVITFNAEVMPRSFIFSSVLSLLYFVLISKNKQLNHE